ncbi:MAG: tetratricopeptide repeat protein [Chloroflexales bacterium]|nr:tetratricopeptide repeat protein [Chloroflexales bacterium]
MSTPQTIETILRAAVPAALHPHLPRLAQLLADVATGALSPAAAQAQLRDPTLTPLLHALAGQQLPTDAAFFSFGAGNQVGDVTIRDVAGGHIITLQPRGDVVVGAKVLTVGLSLGAALALAIGLIIAVGGPRFTQIGLDLLPTAAPAPTPPAFAPASDDESLIIVADFADTSGRTQMVDPDQYIYRALRDRITRDGLAIRVERLPDVLDSNTVRQTGELYHATLVLWGAYDAVGITPYVERIQPVNAQYTDEEGQSLLAADQENITLSLMSDLPALSSYLVLFTLGADMNANAHWETAITYLSSAIAAIPAENTTVRPDEAYFERGLAHWRTAQYLAATRDYDQAITLDPNNAAAYANRGLAHATLQQYDQALADYDQAITLDPNLARAYLSRGQAYTTLQQYDQALADYDQAIALAPAAAAYTNRGLMYAKQDQHDQALADYDQAIALDPAFHPAYHNRGRSYAALQQHDQAFADYDQAIALDPAFAPAYSHRGLAYQIVGKHTLAMADHNQALALAPDLALAYHNRGLTHQRLGEYQRAIADYDQAIALDPNFAPAYSRRGQTYLLIEQYPQALDDFTHYTALQPDDPVGWHTVCWWGSLAGAADAVSAACDQAIDLAPAPERAFYQDARGLNRALHGDRAGALADLRAFVAWAHALPSDDAGVRATVVRYEAWISTLAAGDNPFTEAVLEALRTEIGAIQGDQATPSPQPTTTSTRTAHGPWIRICDSQNKRHSAAPFRGRRNAALRSDRMMRSFIL